MSSTLFLSALDISCKFMRMYGRTGITFESKSDSVELCLATLCMILKIRCWVADSKKSICSKIIPTAPLFKTAGGFSYEIFSYALIHASERSMNPIEPCITVAIPFARPAFTRPLTRVGNMSIRVVKH